MRFSLLSFRFLVTGLIQFCAVFSVIKSENEISGYSDIEITALEKLRSIASNALYRDYMNEDQYLIRWLKAKNLDVNQAADMLRKAHKWRITNKIDSMLEDDPPEFLKKLPHRGDGFDLQGRPFAEIEFGKWNLRKIVLSGQRELYNRHINRILEELTSRARNTGKKNVTTVVILGNFNGYSPRTHACIACIPAQLKAVTDLESYYPNVLHRLFLVNVPRTFDALFQLVQPLMSESTRGILKIFGLDKIEWQKALASHIAVDQRSVSFGGTKKL